jgi:hypothetical protein
MILSKMIVHIFRNLPYKSEHFWSLGDTRRFSNIVPIFWHANLQYPIDEVGESKT